MDAPVVRPEPECSFAWLRTLLRRTQAANLMTVARIPLALMSLPSFLPALRGRMPAWWWGFGLVDEPTPWHRFWQGGLLFVAAALLDLFDGMTARWSKSTSSFGQFGDPLADKIMNWSVFATASVVFFPPSWVHLLVWYIPLWEMLRLDARSTRSHWVDYRRSSREGTFHGEHGACWQGKVKLWAQLGAIAPCLAALCPSAGGSGTAQKLSDLVIAGGLASLQPVAWIFLVAAVYLGRQSVAKRKERMTRYAEAATG